MKKYPKMTFAALSAIALNFSCLAMAPQRNDAPEQNPNKVVLIYNNNIQNLSPLSTEEQISLLKSAISASDVSLADAILKGHVGKMGEEYFYTLTIPIETENKKRYLGIHSAPCITLSNKDFEELQLLALETIKSSNYINALHKREIFKLITSKFYEVADNKKYVCQTTANKMYSNRRGVNMSFFRSAADNFSSLEGKRKFIKQLLNDAKQDNNIDKYIDPFGSVITNFSSDDDKITFVQQFLNDAKQNNDIDAYKEIFGALDSIPEIGSAFRYQPWLQPFIREYLERALRSTNEYIDDMPLGVIKEVAPDLYNEKFFTFLEKCIIEDADAIIDILLPPNNDIRASNLPSDVHRLPTEYINLSKYLNFALKSFNTHFHEDNSGSEYILSSVALYTDTSSDLSAVAQTLASLTQEVRQRALESIKDVNSVLHDLLLEELQRLGH